MVARKRDRRVNTLEIARTGPTLAKKQSPRENAGFRAGLKSIFRNEGVAFDYAVPGEHSEHHGSDSVRCLLHRLCMRDAVWAQQPVSSLPRPFFC